MARATSSSVVERGSRAECVGHVTVSIADDGCVVESVGAQDGDVRLRRGAGLGEHDGLRVRVGRRDRRRGAASSAGIDAARRCQLKRPVARWSWMIWSVVADADGDPRRGGRLGAGCWLALIASAIGLGRRSTPSSALEAGDDRAGGGEDTVGGVLDELDVGAGPVGDVGDRVLAGVDAEDVAHDVGDGLGFDLDPVAGVMRFADLASACMRTWPSSWIWVLSACAGPRSSRTVTVRLDEVGDALRSVGSVERSALEGEAGGVDLLGDRLPQLGWRVVAGEELGLGGKVGRRDELALVEDRDELEADDGGWSQSRRCPRRARAACARIGA